MADPAMREAVAFAVDKDEINSRLLGGTVQIANTSISPGAWFFADQTPATFDPEKAKQILEDAGWTDSDGDGIREKDGLKAKIELCTTTRQVRIDTLALIGDWLKDVGIEGVSNPVDATAIFADYNEATADTPCAPLGRATSTSRSTPSRARSTRSATTSTTTSSQFEPDGANDAQVGRHRHRRRP